MKGRSFIPLLVIVIAGILAYHNSFTVPFVFDDELSIVENVTIRHLWPIGSALSPPPSGGVGGRPLVNLSLAVNYALGSTDVRGYHAMNLAIHIFAGLALFGIVRRTLRQPSLSGRFGGAAEPLALVTALIWVVHPLQTESVTCVIQRSESMMGLFYLLTLYCFIRGTESRSTGIWYTLSFTACLLGMASKEVMVSAPLMVLLYDRTFLSGSFREAWLRRWRLHLALAATWILLGYLVVVTGTESGTRGFGISVAWWDYALTQFRAIVRYLYLSVWPHPLVLDYGAYLASHAAEVVPYAMIIVPLLAGTAVALWRWPSIGFVGAWFFAILSPSSSVVPLSTQTVAEHRMYLPLAAVVTLAVAGGYRVLARRRSVAIALTSAIVLTLGVLTVRRNADYRSEISIWSDTVAKRPENFRAINNLGNALWAAGRASEAIEQYRQALRINPNDAWAHYNLGCALEKMGRVGEAVEHYRQALQSRREFAEAHYNLATVFLAAGKWPDAIDHLERTVRIRPEFAEAWNNLGNALTAAGRSKEAIPCYEHALRIRPEFAVAHNNLANVLSDIGRLPEAIEHYRQALRIKPDFPEARRNLEDTLRSAGQTQSAPPR